MISHEKEFLNIIKKLEKENELKNKENKLLKLYLNKKMKLYMI